MANFVLFHCVWHRAWHGAWVWSRVLPLLRAGGRSAHTVTLTGVGKRAHLLSQEITLETRIADVVNLIEADELQDVILAVHSCAGVNGLEGDDHAWALRQQTPHSIEPCTHVHDPQFWGGKWQVGASIASRATGHDPMVSAPVDLANILRSRAS